MELTMDEARRRNVCQVCAQPGHIKCNCPLREQQVRAQLAIMSPSDRSVWARAVGYLKESDLDSDTEDDAQFAREDFAETQQ